MDSPIMEYSRYESYLLELVELVESEYPATANRESSGLCGFSMGGFGAIHLAARHPEEFASASSLLGPLDIVQWYPEYYRLASLLGGDIATWREHNPTTHCGSLANIHLRFSTGSQAIDRSQNDSFAEALRRLGIPHEYELYSGRHDADWVRRHLGCHFAFHHRHFPSVA
jgi:S-formylglutathione hydrolase FrmB